MLIKLIRPYTRIAIPFISTELNIEPAEVESLLVSCILDKWVVFPYILLSSPFSRSDFNTHLFSIFTSSTIRGRIDQVNQVLELDKESRCSVRYTAMDKWANQLQSLQLAVINKMA